MTDEERAALRDAVRRLNSVLSSLYDNYGSAVRVVPGVNYSTEVPHAAVYVEVMTQAERFN